MIWHVIHEDSDGQMQSRAARSRDPAIQMACELLQQSYEVRRVIGPGGQVIERAELDGHYDNGHFPRSPARRASSRAIGSITWFSDQDTAHHHLRCSPDELQDVVPNPGGGLLIRREGGIRAVKHADGDHHVWPTVQQIISPESLQFAHQRHKSGSHLFRQFRGCAAFHLVFPNGDEHGLPPGPPRASGQYIICTLAHLIHRISR